jgi:hypothetical protein
MKTFSVKNLKMSTRTLYNYNGANNPDKLTETTGTDPTNTTITVLTTTHVFGQAGIR